MARTCWEIRAWTCRGNRSAFQGCLGFPENQRLFRKTELPENKTPFQRARTQKVLRKTHNKTNSLNPLTQRPPCWALRPAAHHPAQTHSTEDGGICHTDHRSFRGSSLCTSQEDVPLARWQQKARADNGKGTQRDHKKKSTSATDHRQMPCAPQQRVPSRRHESVPRRTDGPTKTPVCRGARTSGRCRSPVPAATADLSFSNCWREAGSPGGGK